MGCLKENLALNRNMMLTYILLLCMIMRFCRYEIFYMSVETRTKLEELILAAMVDYGLNRVQRPLRLQQSLIEWFLMVWFTLGHSGQRTSVNCAEATWNNTEMPHFRKLRKKRYASGKKQSRITAKIPIKLDVKI